MRESLARHRATPPTSVASFSRTHTRRALQRTAERHSRRDRGIAGKTRETRNNHPIIKSLTRLRLLLNIAYLPTLPARRRDARAIRAEEI